MKQKAFTAMMAAVVALTAVSSTMMLPERAPLALTAEAAAVKAEEQSVEGKNELFTYLKFPKSKYIEITGVNTAPSGKFEVPEKIEDLPVAVIADSVFAECKELTELVLPDSVRYLKTGAVASCPKLKTVKLSKNLTALPARAFEFCKALESITLPDSLTAINAFAFDNCTAAPAFISPVLPALLPLSCVPL